MKNEYTYTTLMCGVEIGLPVLLYKTNRPGTIGMGIPVTITSPVVDFDQTTGRIETENSIYTLEKAKGSSNGKAA